MVRRTENWQRRVLLFADTVPEVAHASGYVRNTTKRVKMNVLGGGKYDKLLTQMISDAPTGRVCENLFLVGEVLLAYEQKSSRSTEVVWHSYGKNDFVIERGQLKLRMPDGKFAPPPPSLKTFAIYRKDRNDWTKPWSAHKAMLDLLESMYVHQLADTAVATSRLAGAGIMYVPNDEMMDMPDIDGGEPEPGSQAHFEMTLRNAFADSIKNRSCDDAYVPLIMFGSAEFADGLKHLMTERVDDAKAYGERMDAQRKRYGGGIELPAEVVFGMGETNHWAAWKVDQNTWQYYLQPLVMVEADALLENFVRPVAKLLGVKNVQNLRIELDATEVIVKPDRTDAAIRLYSVGALSAEAAIKAAGFDPADVAPQDGQQTGAKMQPDGQVRMPSANFRGSEGEPIGDRNMQR